MVWVVKIYSVVLIINQNKMSQDMDNRMKKIYLCRLNKEFSLKFLEDDP